MNFNRNFALVALMAVLGGSGAAWYFVGDGEEKAAEETAAEAAPGAKKEGKARKVRGKKLRQKSARLLEAKGPAGSVLRRNAKGETAAKAASVTPAFRLEDDEERALTKEQRELVRAIRDALDSNNRKKVLKYVTDLQQSKEWPDGIPLAVRRAAMEALSWIGMAALPEIAGFLADSDPEIRQMSVEAYESALIEANGDRELAVIVSAAAKAIDDADAMESILMSLSDMRNSVQVEVIKEIWKSGTDAAKAAVKDAVEFLTGEEHIDTAELLDAWYNDPSGDNLDGEDDEEFYGKQKD